MYIISSSLSLSLSSFCLPFWLNVSSSLCGAFGQAPAMPGLFMSASTVKNTFIHFDVGSQPTLRFRSRTAPPVCCSLIDTKAEVSQALAPRHHVEARTFTLRRVGDVGLGLKVSWDSEDTQGPLLVTNVAQDGAIEAWNKLCNDPRRVVKPGDFIVDINGARTPAAMCAQCRQTLLLRIRVERGGEHKRGACCDIVDWHNLRLMASNDLALPMRTSINCASPLVSQGIASPDGLFETLSRTYISNVVACCGSTVSVGDSTPHSSSEVEPPTASAAVGKYTIAWVQDAKVLRSKKTRLTKLHRSELGTFTMNIYPGRGKRLHAAGGEGFVHIKCGSAEPSVVARLTSVAIGTTTVIVSHNFGHDGLLCHVPSVCRFEDAIDKFGNFAVVFHFDAASARQAA